MIDLPKFYPAKILHYTIFTLCCSRVGSRASHLRISQLVVQCQYWLDMLVDSHWCQGQTLDLHIPQPLPSNDVI